MALECSQQLAGICFPKPSGIVVGGGDDARPVIGGGHDEATIGADCAGSYPIRMPVEGEALGAGFRVPFFECVPGNSLPAERLKAFLTMRHRNVRFRAQNR